jgi:transmembrane sensor
MGSVNRQIQPSIVLQAAEWFVRNRGEDLSCADRAAFADWLKSSPLHIEEYLKTAVMSHDLHAAAGSLNAAVELLLSEARSDPTENVVPVWGRTTAHDPASSSRLRTRAGRVAAVAAAVVIAFAAAIWIERDGQRFGLPKGFATVHGEQRSWLLPDGTSLNLNSDSAVTVRYDKRERLVQIERGQVLFQVVHENGRRFRVVAGGTGVIAVGTEFEVFRKSGSTLITVAEGKIAVFTGAAPLTSTRATLPGGTIPVTAGEQLEVDDDSPAAKPSMVNVQQAMAWMQRQIAFERRPLGEIAAEFNRYTAVPIVVQNDRLRGLLISGVFSAYDTESFVAFVSRLDDVEIHRTAECILVSVDVNAGQR